MSTSCRHVRPIAIVRMAVDDAYGAKEWQEETPEGVFTTEFTDDVIQRIGAKLKVWSRLRN